MSQMPSRPTKQGVIVSRAGDKTVTVSVARAQKHKLYGKRFVTTKKYLVHDPANAGVVGAQVTIAETRPLSARKRWILVSK